MREAKSWMVAWAGPGGTSKPSGHALRLMLCGLVSLSVLLLPALLFTVSQQPADPGAPLCPCPFPDALASLEGLLAFVTSNFTGAHDALLAAQTCSVVPAGSTDEGLGVAALQPPGAPGPCAACSSLLDGLDSTHDLLRHAVDAASVCNSPPHVSLASKLAWMAAGALAMGLLIIIPSLVAGARMAGLDGPFQPYGLVDTAVQLYWHGIYRFLDAVRGGEDELSPADNPAYTQPAMVQKGYTIIGSPSQVFRVKDRTPDDELAAATAKRTRLQEEVEALRSVAASIELLREEQERLRAAADVADGLQKANEELAATASQLDSLSALNSELRSTVNQVLDLRTQNQQLQPIAALLESVTAKNEQLQQLASQVLELQAQNQQLQATASLFDNVKASNVGLQQAVAQVVELEAQNQQLRGTASLLELVKAANGELLEAVAQVHELQAQNQQLQGTAGMLEQARAVNTKLREMVLQVGELQAQNRQLQSSASYLHSVKALNADLQDRVVQLQRLQRGGFSSSAASTASSLPGKDLAVLRDQEPRASAPHTPTSLATTLSLASPRSLESEGPRNRVFIGGLAATVDEPSLAACFQRYGSVAGTKVVRSAKGQQSRGYGFVTFQLPEHADAAVDAVKEMMALLKPKEGGQYERLTIDYSTSSHLD